MSSKIEIVSLMPGADLIRAGEQDVALGFPEECVKTWLVGGHKPTAWIVPDRRVAGGIVQWAMEFPLYFALFVQGKFGEGQKVPVLVRPSDWPAVVEYLRLTLLGLQAEEMRSIGVSDAVVTMLTKESDHLALSHSDGRIAQIEDFLEPIFFDDEGVAAVGELRVCAHGDNVYSFFTESDRLEEYQLDGSAPRAPYEDKLRAGCSPVVPKPFEVITIGASNGFDPGGPCSNQVVQANGRFLLVDSGPYIRRVLEHSGVSLDQIGALVITHGHEDHAVGLSALLDLTHRVRLFVSRENAEIMRRKLAILNPDVANPETLLNDAFDVQLVEVGKHYDYLGLGLDFHYTMHSIPCTGVTLSVRDGQNERRVMVVGDNNAHPNIVAAHAAGVLSDQRLAELEKLYQFDGELIIADAGGGAIHGLPRDFEGTTKTDVVFVHTGELAAADAVDFSLAEPGNRYAIIEEISRPSGLERGLARKALGRAFGEVDADNLGAVLDAAQALSFNRGHVVLRCGETGRDAFVVLTGELTVLDSERCVARLRAGEIFGEMAAVTGSPRTATVRTETSARLLRVPGAAFLRFAEGAHLPERLPAMWQNRQDLEGLEMLHGASVTARNDLAGHAVRRTIEPGATLIREGSRSNTVFALVAGRVQIYKGDDPLLVNGAPVIVDAGTLLGETAPFLRKTRNASIVAIDECEVLAIRGPDFARIVKGSPQLFRGISRIVRQRQAA